MIAYQFRPMERAVALQIAQWRYAPPYDIYNASEVEEAADEYLTPEYHYYSCLLYTSPSPRDKRQSRMPSSA